MVGKTIEVDEAQFLANQGLAQRVQKMLANPKSREMVQRALKVVEPETPIPELDAAEPLKAGLDEIRKELAAEREARAEADRKREEESKLGTIRQQRESQKKKLMSREGGNYSAEAIAEIEKISETEGLLNLEHAALIFDKMHPPADMVSTSSTGGWGFFEPPPESDESAKFFKDMLESKGENESALNREIGAALAESRGQRRAA